MSTAAARSTKFQPMRRKPSDQVTVFLKTLQAMHTNIVFIIYIFNTVYVISSVFDLHIAR